MFSFVLTVKKQLQPPYQGPYRVIESKQKYFIVDIRGKHDAISIDRLKVAHTDFEFKITPKKSTPVSSSKSAPSNTAPEKSDRRL